MNFTLVDSQDSLQDLLTLIETRMQTVEDQLFFVDLEGVNLSRTGPLAILQLLIPPDPKVYLVDVHQLQAMAFDVATVNGTSLKMILESPSLFKVFFDIRTDSAALHAQYHINVAGVIDLQILEFVTRNPRGQYVSGLAKCIERDLPTGPGWSLSKAEGKQLFAPEHGGSYDVFLVRPLAKKIVQYCVQDVVLMPGLLSIYASKLHDGVAAQIQAIVDARIRLSQTVTFAGKGRHMAVGPILCRSRKTTAVSLSPEVSLLRSDRLRRLCRLDQSYPDDLTRQLGGMKLSVADEGVSSSASSEPSPRQALTSNTASQIRLPLIVTSMDQTDGDAVRGKSTLAAKMDKAEHGLSQLDEDDEDEAGNDEIHRPVRGRHGVGSYVPYHVYTRNDSESEPDYTACSRDGCGYCGSCDY